MNRAFVAFLVLLSLPQSALAQELLETQKEKMQERLSDGQAIVGQAGPLDRAGASISGSSFQFESEDGDAEASLALTFDLDRYEPTKIRAGEYRLSDLRLVTKATVPVGDNDGRQLFAGDNIVSGSRITLALTRSVSFQTDGRKSAQVVLPIYRACIVKKVEGWPTATAAENQIVETFRGLIEPVLKEEDVSEFGAGVRRIARENETDLAKAVRDDCVSKSPLSVANDLGESGKALKKALEEAVFVNKPFRFMGVDATYGRKQFDALNRTDFVVSSVDRDEWEVGAYYGIIGPDVDWSVRGRVVYGQSYEAPDDAQICRMSDQSMDQDCIMGPDGEPTRKRTGLISVEGRKLFNLAENQRFAVAPQVTYDIDEDDFRFELPVYLSPDEKGNLTGGIKFGYTTDEDELVVGLFVGAPFSVFF